VDEIDGAVAAWIGERARDEVLAAFEGAGAAIAPVYDARDVLADPQLEHLGSISTVEDAQLGPLRMPNVISRLSETPGRIRHSGGRHGCDTDAVFAELGIKAAELAVLRADRVI
jgi:crotonobetainyl-CoA:carnitine CoA-transferase CaiB-like acyl-CoA transferase